jgi:hypothetical protein
VCSASANKALLVCFKRLLDAFVVLQLPEFATRCRLQGFVIGDHRILLGEDISIRCVVLIQLNGSRESDKVLDKKSRIIDLSENKRHFHRF